MLIKTRLPLVLGLFVVAALVLAACGSSGDSTSEVNAATAKYAAPTEAPSDAKQGGSLTALAASDVDYIDPGATYYQFGYMVTDATQSPLVGYAPGDIDAEPLLAASEPTVSDDGKTITYKIRDDVKFSPRSTAP